MCIINGSWIMEIQQVVTRTASDNDLFLSAFVTGFEKTWLNGILYISRNTYHFEIFKPLLVVDAQL